MNTKEAAQQIISKEIQNVQNNPFIIKENGCAACHVLFTLSRELQVSEQDASDMLSETLFENLPLNDSFIEMVENIHMKRRMSGTAFAIKTRESKDKYIYSNLKNTLAELLSCFNRGVVLFHEKKRSRNAGYPGRIYGQIVPKDC